MTKSPKRLLTFAHRGEAQAFIQQKKMQAVPFHFAGLYQSENEWLLVTQEGVQSVTESLSAVCAAFANEISEVLNIGIAGCVDKSRAIGEIISIRTAYRFGKNSPVFKSFTSADAQASTDSITVDQRVMDAKTAEILSAFAPIVDRELWACASVCQRFKIPFYAYKMISDFASDGNFCQDVQAQAEQISKQLLTFYDGLNVGEVKKVQTSEANLLSDDFHLTTAQKRQLTTVLQHLTIKLSLDASAILEKVNMAKIAEQKILPKQRTVLLLEALSDQLNPFNANLRKQLAEICQPLTDARCKVNFARDYESDAIELSAKVETPKHLANFKGALEKFDYPAVLALLRGGK